MTEWRKKKNVSETRRSSPLANEWTPCQCDSGLQVRSQYGQIVSRSIL